MSIVFSSSKLVYRVQTAETYFRLQIKRILIMFGTKKKTCGILVYLLPPP